VRGELLFAPAVAPGKKRGHFDEAVRKKRPASRKGKEGEVKRAGAGLRGPPSLRRGCSLQGREGFPPSYIKGREGWGSGTSPPILLGGGSFLEGGGRRTRNKAEDFKIYYLSRQGRGKGKGSWIRKQKRRLKITIRRKKRA